MKNGKQVVYLDTCIYLVVLESDKRDLDLFDGALHAWNRVEAGDVYLIVSTMIELEMPGIQTNTAALDKFRKFLRRSNVQEVGQTKRVPRLATELQAAAAKSSRRLKGPDAIHLATSILYGADEFYTNDGPLTGVDGTNLVPGMPVIGRPPKPLQMKLGDHL